jgi:hypothetical protein
VVLNDGKTFSRLHRCMIIRCPDPWNTEATLLKWWEMLMTDYKYDVPILDDNHAEFCKREAERRYCGKIIVDGDGMFLVEELNGDCHTDEVLRALSVREDGERRSHAENIGIIALHLAHYDVGHWSGSSVNDPVVSIIDREGTAGEFLAALREMDEDTARGIVGQIQPEPD